MVIGSNDFPFCRLGFIYKVLAEKNNGLFNKLQKVTVILVFLRVLSELINHSYEPFIRLVGINKNIQGLDIIVKVGIGFKTFLKHLVADSIDKFFL